MRTDSDPINRYLHDLILCRRHPSRRASSSCVLCGHPLCRRCNEGFHPCPCLPAMAPRAPWSALGLRFRRESLLLALMLAFLTALFWPLGHRPGMETRFPERSAGVSSLSRPSGGTGTSQARAREMSPARAPSPRPSAGSALAPAGKPAGLGAAPRQPLRHPPSLLQQADPAAPSPAGRATAAHLSTHAPAEPVRSFNRGPASRRALVLTFDGGSTTEGALDILDALRSKGIRTTFFLTGVFIRKNPALVRRLVADGHEIGNHTDTHRHLTLWASLHQQVTRPEVDRLWLHNELHRAAAAFRAVTGGDMSPLWRAPYGEYNTQILRWAQEEGWTHVGWTGRLDSLDWVSDKHSRIYHSADQIAARLLAFPDVDAEAGHGGIILMHLGSDRPDRDRLSRVLPRILQGFAQRGFEFVTASDMMHSSGGSR